MRTISMLLQLLLCVSCTVDLLPVVLDDQQPEMPLDGTAPAAEQAPLPPADAFVKLDKRPWLWDTKPPSPDAQPPVPDAMVTIDVLPEVDAATALDAVQSPADQLQPEADQQLPTVDQHLPADLSCPAAGQACNDGNPCTFGDVVVKPTCQCVGTSYGCPASMHLCMVNKCDGLGGCYLKKKPLAQYMGCWIDGACWPTEPWEAAQNPRNTCQYCDPGVSEYQWTTGAWVTEGSFCEPGSPVWKCPATMLCAGQLPASGGKCYCGCDGSAGSCNGLTNTTCRAPVPAQGIYDWLCR